jgi:hypothetical protein
MRPKAEGQTRSKDNRNKSNRAVQSPSQHLYRREEE